MTYFLHFDFAIAMNFFPSPRQMDGSLSKAQKRWRSEIVKLAASLEAYIDFGESDDIEVQTMGTNVACSEANFKRIEYLFLQKLEKEKLFPNYVFRLLSYPSPA